MEKSSASLPASLVVHCAALSLLFILSRHVTGSPPMLGIAGHMPLMMPRLTAADTNPVAGGGGGDHSLTPASRGEVLRMAPDPLTPPSTVIRDEEPKLPVIASVAGPEKVLATIGVWGILD